MAELRKALITLPNLLKLSVESVADSPIRGGQVLLDPLATENWRLPPLKYLRLRGMGFQLASYHNTQGWERWVQWECLEHLESSDTFFFALFMPPLKALRSLALFRAAFDMVFEEGAFAKLLYSLPKLEHLSAPGLTYQVTKYRYLEHHGKTLKTLRLYEDTDYIPWPFVGPEPDEGNIRRFGRTCPNLETCAIDVRVRGGDWVSQQSHTAAFTQKLSRRTANPLTHNLSLQEKQPWDLLTRIAESLTSIIHLELIVSLRHDFGQPQVTLDSVRAIWSFLWRDIARVRRQPNHHPSSTTTTPTTTPRLRTLKISTADTKTYTARFEARLAERDDLAAR
ncbi:MAG: hypothetical protein Q9228_003523, partial [Teloschistes exilis]